MVSNLLMGRSDFGQGKMHLISAQNSQEGFECTTAEEYVAYNVPVDRHDYIW